MTGRSTIEGASHRYDRLKTAPHHWIEEGTEDDFKWNIINSDLPEFGVVFAGTGSWGTHTTDFLMGYRGATFMEHGMVDAAVLARPADHIGMALTGTVTVGAVPYPAAEVADDYQHFEVYYHTLSTSVNKKLVDALLARPEVVKHEQPKAAPLGA